jgi:hypothetical protein
VAAEATKAESKNKKKRKLDSSHLDTLTGDERMAVELYHAIKKTRKASSEGEEEEEEGEEEKQMENTYNNSGDALVDAEEEKRAITYQIAKNKVCYIPDVPVLWILIRIRIQWFPWIRIRFRNPDPDPGEQKKKKVPVINFNFEVLDVLFCGLKASPVAWTSFMEA